jgi:diaminopimelate epimerase
MKFTKMHGIGNDYIFVNAIKEKITNPQKLSIRVSDRHFGVGSDGLILILPSKEAQFKMRIFNADGSEAEMCGNGLRCFAKYVHDHGLTKEKKIKVETLAGILEVEMFLKTGKVEKVRVDMGAPRLLRYEIPMIGNEKEQVVLEQISVGGTHFEITAVSMGNPHAVIFVEDVHNFPVQKYGPMIENHDLFPNRTNVEFVQVVSPTEVIQSTWERGSGETLACGTGASAVAVAGFLTGKTERNLLVHLSGGDLEITWDEATNHIFKVGPAVEVFSGTWGN